MLMAILLFGCAQVGLRSPSSEGDLYEQLTSFKESTQTELKKEEVYYAQAGEPIDKKIKDTIGKEGFLEVILEKKENLAEGVSYKFVPEISSDGRYLFKILYLKDSHKDIGASTRLLSFLSEINKRENFNTVFEFFELMFNAKEGDLMALNQLVHLKHFLEMSRSENENDEYLRYMSFAKESGQKKLLEENEFLLKELSTEIDSLNDELAKEKKLVRNLEKKRRDSIKLLDSLPDEHQLQNLASAGDREGIASLLEKYLPFEHMAPTEKKYWLTMLEVIRNPVPLDQRILLYRGIEGDMIYPLIKDGVELSKDEALSQGKVSLMSSLMTKNQGSWNRRLRSLQTMYSKRITQNRNRGTSELTRTSRMSTIFFQHSRDPVGSPFLSWTPSPQVANNFGESRMSAQLIDPRMAMVNYASMFEYELEILTPLVTFPEDMIAVYDQGIHGPLSLEGKEDFFLERLRNKLKENLGEDKAQVAYDRIVDINKTHRLSKEVNNLGEGKLKKGFLGSLGHFFNKIFKKETNGPADAPQGSELKKSCTYFLKFFFNSN